MKNREYTQITAKMRIGALLVSLLTVGAALAFIVHGKAIGGYIRDFASLLPANIEPGELEIHFIDVGQGDAILVRTDDTNLLIDCGTNGAESELVKYLRSLWIGRLDCVILTHPHDDHIGGADKVLESFRIGRVIMPETDSESVQLEKLRSIMDKRGIPLESPKLGTAYLAGELKFMPLAPEANFDDNNASLVIRVEFGELSFLFTGDAERESELAMLERFDGELEYLLDCDLLKLGHHGSNTSTSEEFLAAVTPEWVAITCGFGNEFGHPHREVLNRLAEHGISDDRILRTDKSGTIVISTFGETLEVQSKPFFN